jgi:putative ABC transport system permease protein
VFLRLLIESFRRQRRRKLLAGLAILLGTTAVTAMLALATSIGDRIHRELAVYGANIVVTPKADTLDVKLGGLDLKPATGGAYLHEADLEKLKTIFWANNITGVSPELSTAIKVSSDVSRSYERASLVGLQFQPNPTLPGDSVSLHPSWKLNGRWPKDNVSDGYEAVVGSGLATKLGLPLDHSLYFDLDDGDLRSLASNPIKRPRVLYVTGILAPGSGADDSILVNLSSAQDFLHSPGAISRVEISAKTRPEDAFARQDPDKLSPAQHDIWYCRPYANSIAYQIQEAIPGARAQQVRQVEQTEGTVLERISGLMWLISAAALLAAGFAVSAAMATAVLERRTEIGIMRSLGASHAAIAALFYAESSILAVATGTLGFFAGSGLAWELGRSIFSADGASAAPVLNLVLLPVVVALALLVAIGGSAPSIRAALLADPAQTLRSDA